MADRVIADRFELLRRAGAGGMGEVWHARDRTTGSDVALKLLLAADALTLARFQREAAGLARVAHPHVVRFLDYGVDAKRGPWLVMQWLEGEALSARLRRGRMTPAESVAVGRALTAALAAMHAVGLIHRDLKPANIILRKDTGGPCLVDFGLVRALEGEIGLTGSNMLVGTPRYMSPEQVRGTPAADARADLWSLGAVIYECIAGAPAFSGSDGLAILAKVLLEPIEPVETRAKDVSPELAALVTRLLMRDRADRPASAAAVLAELDRIAARESAARTVAIAPGLSSVAHRLAAVVAIAPPIGSTPAIAEALAQTAANVAGLHRAQAERVRSEGVVVTIPGRMSARDQAVLAARIALAMRAAAPGARLALTLARTRGRESREGSSTIGLGAAIDRATIFLASDEAEAGPIPIDEGTARLLGQRFHTEPRPSGGMWLLVAERATSTSALFAASVTPFIGRAREHRRLVGRAALALAGQSSRASVVVGDVGVGKSRLVREVLGSLARTQPGMTVWFAQGDPSRDAAPWSIAGDLLKHATGLSPSVSGEIAGAVLERLIAPVTPPNERGRVVAFLGETLGVAIPGVEEHLRAVRSDFALWGEHVRSSLSAVVDAITSPARTAGGGLPALVIVIDDAHLADRPTADWLARALAAFPDRHLFILATGRPAAEERMRALLRNDPDALDQLGDLTDADVRELALHGLARSARAPEAAGLAERIVQQVGGNPLFAEEMLHELLRGGGTAAASLLALAEERLASVPEVQAHVLRAASAFGRTFSRDALPKLLPDRALATIDEALAALAQGGWIVASGRSAAGGGYAFSFRHGVLRDAAYAQMAEEDRVRAHSLVAGWLDDRGEREAALIAAHWALAKREEEAAPHFARAAEQALTGSDLDAAIALARRAIEHARSPNVRGRAAIALAEACRWKGSSEDALAAAELAMSSLTPREDRWFAAAGEHCLAASRLRRLGDVVATAGKLEATLCPAPSAAQVVAVSRAAVMLLHANVEVRAAPLYTWLESVAPELEVEPIAACRRAFAFAWRAHTEGDWAAYASLLRLAAAGADRAGDRRTACQMRGNIGHALHELGAYAEARKVLEAERAAAEELGLVPTVMLCLNNLGPVLARTGDLAGGIAAEQAAIDAYARGGDTRLAAASRVYLSALLEEAGRIDEALEEAQKSVEGSRSVPLILPRALAQLANVHRARGEVREAVAAAESALEGVGSAGRGTGHTPVLHLAAAEASLAAGDAASAAKHARNARRELLTVTGKIDDPDLRATYLATRENRRILELTAVVG